MILPEDFTLPQLRNHIRKRLGGGVWRLEGMGADQSDTIDTGISEALHAYSRRCPRYVFEALPLATGTGEYKLQTKVVYGVGRVDFLHRSLIAHSTPVFSVQGLITHGTPVFLMQGQDYLSYTMWRKSFQRVTGIAPKWHWDDHEKVLKIYNPANSITAGIMAFAPVEFDEVRLVHKDWLRRASLAHVKLILGENRRKFGDAIPGPTGDIKLNGDKLVDEAEKAVEELQKELLEFQPRAVPSFD